MSGAAGQRSRRPGRLGGVRTHDSSVGFGTVSTWRKSFAMLSDEPLPPERPKPVLNRFMARWQAAWSGLTRKTGVKSAKKWLFHEGTIYGYQVGVRLTHTTGTGTGTGTGLSRRRLSIPS